MKLGLYHLVAANLVIWGTTVITEAGEQFAHALSAHHGEEGIATEGHEGTNSMEAGGHSSVTSSAELQPSHHQESRFEMELHCLEDDPLGGHIGAYLFPFIIEYALIAASICYRIYCNIGEVPEHGEEPRSTVIKNTTKVGTVCHKANTGLFRGLVVLVAVLLFTCIFLMFKEGQYIIHATEIVESKIYFGCNMGLNILTLLVLPFTLKETRKLHLLPSLENSFDQNLALIALCGYYFMVFFMTIAGASQLFEDEHSYFAQLHLASNILTFTQITLQTLFLVDAMRRHSSTHDHVIHKPGRSAVSFLLVLNIAMWLVNTFQLKELTFSKVMIHFYGQLQWILISQMFLPLAIFYRFHSAVCFAEIWSHSYRPNKECENHFIVTGQIENGTLPSKHGSEQGVRL